MALCFENKRLWVLRCLQNIGFELLLGFSASNMLMSLLESLKIRGLLRVYTLRVFLSSMTCAHTDNVVALMLQNEENLYELRSC